MKTVANAVSKMKTAETTPDARPKIVVIKARKQPEDSSSFFFLFCKDDIRASVFPPLRVTE